MIEDILIVKAEAPIWFVDKDLLKLYLYMLAHADMDLIVSKSHLSAVQKVAAKTLVDAGYINSDPVYRVGYVSDGHPHLYVNELNPLLPELKLVKDMVTDYSKRHTKKQHVMDAGVTLVKYLEEPALIKNTFDCQQVWQSFLVHTYGKVQRDLTGKERGQFTHLYRMYGGTHAVKMIILYLTEATAPNIGELLLKKDKYYHKFVTKSEKEKLKDDAIEEGFFKT